MKFITVVGARPNFVKIAPLVKYLPDNIIVHTGQHYDYNMSKVFFEGMDIPEPTYNLNVGSGTHTEQTSTIMSLFEPICVKEKPDIVIVVGDVNSTLACSLVVSKMDNVKLAHIESGERSFDRSMPEEINRVITDHISDYLFCSTKDAMYNLLHEGISNDKIYHVGNIVIDNIVKYKDIIDNTIKPSPQHTLFTLHRPFNTDNREQLKNILQCINEVAQFGRDVARMLNLNQDLAEAIGLAHDLGHTPFGHAGQEALNEVMETFGTHFEHNEQSFRVVHELERKSDKYKGLNLSFEVLDGLLKHRTRYDRPAAFDHLMPSLEAQIVNIADEIAYQSHDIDDGLRSGILSDKVLMKLEICKRATAEKRLSGDSKIRQHQIVTSIMALLVNDLAGNTNRKLKKLGIRTVADIYAHDGQVALFSDEVNHMAVQLKDYLFNHFYNAREVMKYNEEGKNVITGLFRTLYENPEKLPEKYQAQLENEERYVVIKDYVAGMTDSFAMDLYNKLVK